MGNIGIWGIAILLVVALLLFGPKRLPQMGRSLGRGMREFKDTVTDQTKELKEATIDTPKQFKDGLNPFKSTDETPSESAAPAASAAPAPEPTAVASDGAPEKTD
jgi:sec-independent protein translocase protein TatA